MSSTFVINDQTYSCNKLNAFDQLFVCRKTSEIFIGLGSKELNAPNAFELLAQVKEEDLDAVMKRILPAGYRRNPANEFVPIYVATVQTIVFPDIDGITLLRIIFEILMEYLAPFFSGFDLLISGTPSQNPQENGQVTNTRTS